MYDRTCISIGDKLRRHYDMYVQLSSRSIRLPVVTLRNSSPCGSRIPLGDNLLATADMVRIRRRLTFDAAVPIEVASTASLGGDADLVRTGRVGAGLGRPVAVGAPVLQCFAVANAKLYYH